MGVNNILKQIERSQRTMDTHLESLATLPSLNINLENSSSVMDASIKAQFTAMAKTIGALSVEVDSKRASVTNDQCAGQVIDVVAIEVNSGIP